MNFYDTFLKLSTHQMWIFLVYGQRGGCVASKRQVMAFCEKYT